MPITQDRFVLLLDEAEAFRNAYDYMQKTIADICIYHRAHKSETEVALSDIQGFLSEQIRPIAENILVERRYFNSNYRRNAKSAERMRMRRSLTDYVMENITGETDESPGTIVLQPFQQARAPRPVSAPSPAQRQKPLTMSPEAMAQKAIELAARPSDKDLVGMFTSPSPEGGPQTPNPVPEFELSDSDKEELELEALMAECPPADADLEAQVKEAALALAREKAGLKPMP